MISFAESNTSDSSSRFTAIGIDSGLPIVVPGGGCDYSSEAIFLKHFRHEGGGVVIPGRPLIEGRLL